MSMSSRPKSRMIGSPAIGSTRRSLSPLKGADHPAATILPDVQGTARRTRALGIFKGAGSAGYRLLGGSRRSAFAVPVCTAEAELPILLATARGLHTQQPAVRFSVTKGSGQNNRIGLCSEIQALSSVYGS